LVVHWNSFGIYRISSVSGYKPKYSCIIMYECENSPSSHKLVEIGTFYFSHLNLFWINVICKNQPHKSPRVLFPFFGIPTLNKPKIYIHWLWIVASFGYLLKNSLCYDNSKSIKFFIQCDYSIYNIVVLNILSDAPQAPWWTHYKSKSEDNKKRRSWGVLPNL
jgi:hypothetical protein